MIFIIGREQCVFRIKKLSIYSGFMCCINILITQCVMRQSEPIRDFAASRLVALMHALSHCFSRRANGRESCAVTSIARLFELLNNWRHNNSLGYNRKVINIRTRIRGSARGGSGAAREQSTCLPRTHNIVFNSSCFNINFNIHAYNYRMGFP